MNSSVPPIQAGGALAGPIGLRARWKSRSIGWPSPASRALDGLTSMWTRSRSCAYCRPSASTAPIEQIASTYEARRDEAAIGAAGLQATRTTGPDPIQDLDDLLAAPLGDGSILERLEDLGQRRTAEERHAQDLEVPVADHVLGVERHDVHVLEPRQREMLLATAGRDLHHHGPIAQRGLCGQEDPARRAAAKLGEQPEAGEHFADVREHHPRRRRFHQALAIE